MPVAPPKMGEADLLDRMSLVTQIFRLAAPIDRRSLFAGRSDQIADVFSVVAQPGQHAVIYGERGVGKTSLAGVAAEMLASANVLTARATCDVSDDFASVWQKSLGEIVIHSSAPALGFTDQIEARHSASELLGSSVTPDSVRRALQRVRSPSNSSLRSSSTSSTGCAILRAGSCSRTRFKTLSDRVVDVTVFLMGVADSVGELIGEHRSIERALAQIHMPRLAPAELAEIATRGIATARMEIAGGAVKKITTLSLGLPHYT